MSETETRQAEARSTGGESTGGESTGGDEIEMSVVKVGSLPEKFRSSPPGGAPATEDVPGPIAELIRVATSGLTGPERKVFLRRLKEKHPGLFSGETGGDGQESPEGLPEEFSEEQFSEEEWREELTRLLKEEANRFMAAAAGL
ncbi:hypothetical protein GGP65_003139 [Salinibacter ruber]|uniref:Uncharacterized protein n=1 Tax=Salinibacter ruber TaxID=146919 RepID=A0AAW5PD72_9BACT|nr:hypothetical protein [Salinibacter ruber]MCS3665496.1 hypothetical protein [Salinibacter ruber]MCS4159548.1 hypothetical protein [Salinibacter ruber]MCS4223714.1 hypothetical protein [Salinibacter ruber]